MNLSWINQAYVLFKKEYIKLFEVIILFQRNHLNSKVWSGLIKFLSLNNFQTKLNQIQIWID
jgi:hypothetical protein